MPRIRTCPTRDLPVAHPASSRMAGCGCSIRQPVPAQAQIKPAQRQTLRSLRSIEPAQRPTRAQDGELEPGSSDACTHVRMPPPERAGGRMGLPCMAPQHGCRSTSTTHPIRITVRPHAPGTGWSHAAGNGVVPSDWQTTARGGWTCPRRSRRRGLSADREGCRARRRSARRGGLQVAEGHGVHADPSAQGADRGGPRGREDRRLLGKHAADLAHAGPGGRPRARTRGASCRTWPRRINRGGHPGCPRALPSAPRGPGPPIATAPSIASSAARRASKSPGKRSSIASLTSAETDAPRRVASRSTRDQRSPSMRT